MVTAFGIPQLDRSLGSIPEHARVLLLNDPAVDATPFLRQCAAAHASRDRPVVYVVTSRAPSQVLTALADDGYGSAAAGISFIDAYTPLLGMDSDAAYRIADPANLEEVAAAIERAAREHAGAVLLIDHLSGLLDAAGSAPFQASLPVLLQAMARYHLCAAAFTFWPYGAAVDHVRSHFDAVVRLQAIEDRVVMSQSFRLESARWFDGRTGMPPRLYTALRPGGVHVYIPKVLVTGPFNSGKSTFIHDASDDAVSVDRLGTTVALDRGRVRVDGVRVDLFGTPGQARFDPLLETLRKQALGVVLLVDSSRPETFARAQEMLRQVWRSGLPAIVAANKQDLRGALTPEEVARRLQTPANVPVVPCSSQMPGRARAVLNALIERILEQKVTA